MCKFQLVQITHNASDIKVYPATRKMTNHSDQSNKITDRDKLTFHDPIRMVPSNQYPGIISIKNHKIGL